MAVEQRARPDLPAVRGPLEDKAPLARLLQCPDQRVLQGNRAFKERLAQPERLLPWLARPARPEKSAQPAIKDRLAVKGMLGQPAALVPLVALGLRAALDPLALRGPRGLRARAQIFLLLMKAQSSQPESYRSTLLVLVLRLPRLAMLSRLRFPVVALERPAQLDLLARRVMLVPPARKELLALPVLRVMLDQQVLRAPQELQDPLARKDRRERKEILGLLEVKDRQAFKVQPGHKDLQALKETLAQPVLKATSAQQDPPEALALQARKVMSDLQAPRALKEFRVMSVLRAPQERRLLLLDPQARQAQLLP